MINRFKFRAWYTGDESMIPPMDIQYMIHQKVNSFPMKMLYDDMIFMQFTGLLDKNGKEIYEGDILKFGETIQKIVFNRGCFYMEDSDQAETVPAILDIKYHEFAEIIGNIYENENLLH